DSSTSCRRSSADASSANPRMFATRSRVNFTLPAPMNATVVIVAPLVAIPVPSNRARRPSPAGLLGGELLVHLGRHGAGGRRDRDGAGPRLGELVRRVRPPDLRVEGRRHG